jgi:DNA-binding PadR family transcriptional regulator
MMPGFGRMRRWGGLRYMILYQLRDTPLNGVEIMEKTENMSMGWWRPSPGSIYPMLNSLVEESFIVKRDDGRYAITQRGIEEISGWGMPHQGQHSVERAVEELENNLTYLEDSPPDKVAPFATRVKRIGERAQKLGSRS